MRSEQKVVRVQKWLKMVKEKNRPGWYTTQHTIPLSLSLIYNIINLSVNIHILWRQMRYMPVCRVHFCLNSAAPNIPNEPTIASRDMYGIYIQLYTNIWFGNAFICWLWYSRVLRRYSNWTCDSDSSPQFMSNRIFEGLSMVIYSLFLEINKRKMASWWRKSATALIFCPQPTVFLLYSAYTTKIFNLNIQPTQ